jgi:hypothetical protein
MSAAPVPATPVPAGEFERFVATLPELLRDECRTRFAGSGISPNHPVFTMLADFHEKKRAGECSGDFYEEALLHANNTKQLLADFRDLPSTIRAQCETQLQGLLAAFTGPMDKLERTAADLSRNVEALPILLLPKRARATTAPAGFWKNLQWRIGARIETARLTLADRAAWIVAGGACTCGAAVVTAIVLSLGARHLSSYYEASYRQRLAHLEADSLDNTIALNRLLSAGISLKIERDRDGNAYYLILRGAHKAAPPISSPEGLAVEVWP